MPPLLDENAVVCFTKEWLERNGWHVRQALRTSDVGVDLIAEKATSMLHVEAKGATSARLGSARFGKGFNSNQVADRVMKGFYTAAMLAEAGRITGVRAALALPDLPEFRKHLSRVAGSLSVLGIVVIWVNRDGKIMTDPAGDFV